MHRLVPGSAIPSQFDDDEIHDPVFTQCNKKFVVTREDLNENKIEFGDLVHFSKKFLGAPYLWGGRSPFGIDCSGLVQILFKIKGIALKRDAWQQAEAGKQVSFIEESVPGDLVFFDNDEGKIIHVGMIYQSGHIIHASGEVRIDKIDNYGIYNQETGKYTHKTRIIKRVDVS
jgi:cell wall-associated NlpC family hydrolase